MFRMWMGIVLLTVAAAFSGCNILGGDDDGDGHVSLDNAEYFGTLEDPDGNLFRMKVIFDDDGNISGVEKDGVSQGWTAEVTHEEGDLFSFVLDLGDGSELFGGFLAKGSHAGFVSEDYDIGALEKDATALANSYGMSDIAGGWDGYTVEVDSAFAIEDKYNSEITISSDGSFDGSDDNGVEFSDATPLSVSDGTYGRFLGESIDSDGQYQSEVRAFLTPDKEFAAVAACYGGFPDECTLSAWEKD